MHSTFSKMNHIFDHYTNMFNMTQHTNNKDARIVIRVSKKHLRRELLQIVEKMKFLRQRTAWPKWTHQTIKVFFFHILLNT